MPTMSSSPSLPFPSALSCPSPAIPLYETISLKNMRRKFVTFLWSVFLLTVALAALGMYSISKGWIGYMPDLEEIQSPISKYASQVISADGKLLGTWSKSENRVFTGYDSISPYVFQALIATEDARFYAHSGIDAIALGRAVIKRGILGQKNAGGGSTISQQLAKQLYSETAKSTTQRLLQKPIEWVIAVEIERYYTKEEIMTLYLNYFDFLHNAVGIKTAANVYFGKSPKNLSIHEAAMLIGMCKNPSYFNPVRNPERCLARRNVVLDQMVKAGYIGASERDSLGAKELGLNFHRVDHKEGTATYLREYLRQIMMAKKPERSNYQQWQLQQYYVDSLAWEHDALYGWCNKNRKKDGAHYDIYTDGLKIFTTVDSRMQRYAEESMYGYVALELQPEFNKQRQTSPNFPYSTNLNAADINRILQRTMRQTERYRSLKAEGMDEDEIFRVFSQPVPMTVFSYHGDVDTVMTPLDSIKYYKSFLRSGLVSIDPSNGHVKAYVGGLDYTHFQYDMAMQGRRQVGSTMKPFVYALAMEEGYSPMDVVANVHRTYYVSGQPWAPRNGSHARYGQMVTLKWGLSQSNNWVTAGLMYQIDPTGSKLKRYLGNFGVSNRDIHPSISLCLGTCDITVAEMASAYTAFANRGMRCAPLLVTRIEDNEGNVVAEFTPRMNEVISEQTSFYMIDMLRAVVDQGTGRRLRFKYRLEGPIAGKTGTTNNNSDGWFVGFVPRLVTACWVGGEERDIHFNSMSLGQGASTALPVWAYYMKKVFRNKALGYSPAEEFELKADSISATGIQIGAGADEGEVELTPPEGTTEDVFD